MDEVFNITTLLEKYVVYIPEIQRDYAQGRDSASKIRQDLLDDLFKVLRGEKDQIVLNYIYGVPKKDEKIVLIDGQQRTTTLFLLKYYLALRMDKDTNFLSRLCYATRESSREFCKFLSTNKPKLNDDKPSTILKNNTHFKKRWLNDPTIDSMLKMLDAINDHYINSKNVQYENLDNVVFSFVSLDGFKRTDELYASMNSRGKQLTHFELIKGLLLQKEPNLSKTINGEWLPLFWNISKEYSLGSDDKEKFAAEKHDSFLYNYFSFIATMLWWSKYASLSVKKEEMPDPQTIAKIVFIDNDEFEFLKFSMDLVKTDLCNNSFEDLTLKEEEYSSDKIVLYDGKSLSDMQLFKTCCFKGKGMTQAEKCYLWAYIKYKWDEKNNKKTHELVDYYILMRSLFMLKASNETPMSVGKLSLNEEQLGHVIKPFFSITNGESEYKDYTQYKVFELGGDLAKKILNNPLVRGCSDNVYEYFSDKLKNNLDWLWKNIKLSEPVVFKRLSNCGFGYFKCEFNGYNDRVFLPVTEKILQSIFSIKGWKKLDSYKSFMDYLKSNDISTVTDQGFTSSDWRFYVEKYNSFRDSMYGQYRIDSNTMTMDLNAEFIENERATKKKKRNPITYEIYINKKQSDETYESFVENHSVVFKAGKDECELSYDGIAYSTDMSTDIIDSFIAKINHC